MAKLKVKIDGEKFKDGDKVTVVIVGTLQVGKFTYNDGAHEVSVKYGDGHEFYLSDAMDMETVAKSDGFVVVKH